MKKKKQINTTLDKQPENFLKVIENDYRIWGVDPDIATLVDTSGRQTMTSWDEYYHLCGYNFV